MAQDTVALIKDRLSIVEIVSPYVKLTRAGKSLRGLCPFHKEKTPSFHVSPERGTFHCFGCGEGGDGFSFIEKVENVDFKDALKILAEKAGIPVEYAGKESREDASKRERLYALMSRASAWYAGRLIGSPAETYAKKRGLTDETIRAWQLGYAPDAWRALLEALTGEGFTTRELHEAGLIKEADGKQGTYYDRFRNRLLFPICDASGHVVAFTGRALAADEPAKYLNSPETELYHKSDILFGMSTAKEAIRARGFVMLVEGQMDVLHAHQAGFTNAVALSGTALSERHLRLMKRYSENLMLVLDADRAGLDASDRSVKLALGAEMNVKAAGLSQGKDPADLISENEKEFAKCIANAQPVEEFFLTVLGQTEHNPRQLERDIKQMVFPLIDNMRNPIKADRAIQSTAGVLGVDPMAVRESLRRLSRQPEAQKSAQEDRTSKTPARAPSAIRSEQLLAVIHAYPDSPLAERVKSEYLRITEAHALPLETLPEPALFEAERRFGEDPEENAADELLHAFEEAVVREAYQEAVARLRRAEAARDISQVEDAQAACARLSVRLAALGH